MTCVDGLFDGVVVTDARAQVIEIPFAPVTTCLDHDPGSRSGRSARLQPAGQVEPGSTWVTDNVDSDFGHVPLIGSPLTPPKPEGHCSLRVLLIGVNAAGGCAHIDPSGS